MAPVGLPVVVRVKRKRDLDPVDTIVVEADETPAAKRRARDAALAVEHEPLQLSRRPRLQRVGRHAALSADRGHLRGGR